jgi:CoA:oxalate CoA-transferase
VIQGAGVPIRPLLHVAEAITHHQTRARNMLIDAGGLKMIENPIKISGSPDQTVRSGAPGLIEHGPALRVEFTSAKLAHPV